jgi:hypothetical protein
MSAHYRRFVVIIGVVIFALTAYVASLGDLTRAIPRFLAAFAGLHILYVVAVYLLTRLPQLDRRTLVLIFLVAVACRAVNLGSPPTLSNDIYRYLWEGRVVEAGLNPFAYPPGAPELEHLRDSNYESINHKHLGTIYPPLAQEAFYLGVLIKPGLISQKVMFVIFDLSTMVLIMLLLRSRGQKPGLCVVYGWSPLVILEFSHSGHMDSLGIFFLVLTLLLIDKGRSMLGFTSMALSFLAKYLSIALLPFFVFKKRYAVWLPLSVIVVVLGYIPFAGASTKLVSSLGVYGRHWEFNSLVFAIAQFVVKNPAWIRVGLGAFVVFFAFYQGYRRSDIVRYTYLAIGCALLLSPTVYPWYLCWIVPFLCFYISRAWLFLTGAIVLSYWVWVGWADTGVWQVSMGLLLVEYVPFLLLLAYDAYRARLSSGRRVTKGVSS